MPFHRRRHFRFDRARASRGQSLVEFVLIVPVLLLMLLITLDFGRLFLSYVTLTNVTRVAANFGSTNPDAFTGTPMLGTYNAVVSHESAGLNCDLQADGGGHNPPIPTFPSGTGLSGRSVSTMTCEFQLLTPLIGSILGSRIPISASAEFPVRVGAIANIGGSTNLPPPGSPVAAFDFVGVTGGTVNGAGDVTGTPPVTVSVDDNSSNAQTWDWDWGDLTPHDTSEAPIAHQYVAEGAYTVTLTVSNTQGSASTSRTVTVGTTPTAPPVAGFYGIPSGSAPQADGGGPTGTAITGSRPLTVTFTNTSTDATAYSWNFGDGSAPSTAASPQHAFTALGRYTVTLTITDPAGGTPFTRQNYVTVGCVVPNFANTSTSAAQATWSGANFTGTITYQPTTANPNSNGQTSSTPPSPPRNIAEQMGLNGGSWVPPTKPTGNGPWCGSDIRLRYTP